MFRAKTLFVIGAGASTEVGLPVGSELLANIVRILSYRFDYGRQISGDRYVFEALKLLLDEGREVERLNQHLTAALQLARSSEQALSIDNVIDALEDEKIELVGKLGIIRAIWLAEDSSSNFKIHGDPRDGIDLSKFSNTWYSSFTKLLTENVKKSEIADIFENVEIINFNYDRCLEHYLPYSLSNYYGLDIDTVRPLVQSMTVHRPYGIAGRLPWHGQGGPAVEFGGGNPVDLAQVVQQVRTFTERIDEGAMLHAMRESVQNADRIIFLGFAFHRQNLALIASAVQDHTQIIATAFGVSKSDRDVIRDEIIKSFSIQYEEPMRRVHLSDLTCAEFFKEYWRTVTADQLEVRPKYIYNLDNM